MKVGLLPNDRRGSSTCRTMRSKTAEMTMRTTTMDDANGSVHGARVGMWRRFATVPRALGWSPHERRGDRHLRLRRGWSDRRAGRPRPAAARAGALRRRHRPRPLRPAAAGRGPRVRPRDHGLTSSTTGSRCWSSPATPPAPPSCAMPASATTSRSSRSSIRRCAGRCRRRVAGRVGVIGTTATVTSGAYVGRLRRGPADRARPRSPARGSSSSSRPGRDLGAGADRRRERVPRADEGRRASTRSCSAAPTTRCSPVSSPT